MALPEGLRMKNERLLPPWTVGIMGELKQHEKRYAHSIRVGFVVYALWRDLIETNQNIELRRHLNNLFISGLVHDCGKTGIPDATQDVTETLNGYERALLAWHAHIGAALVYHHDRDIADIIRGHHSWGTGLTQTARPPYFIDRFAQEEVLRDDYPIIRTAQIVLAVADKADSAINRGEKGIGGGMMRSEIDKYSKRFEEEVKSGDVTPEMLERALRHAKLAGRYQKKYWKL